MTALTDQELVARATGGDRQALDDLLRRHQPRIVAVCQRMTGNATDGADAAQEAELAQGLASAADGPLKSALLALGRNVLKRNRPA